MQKDFLTLLETIRIEEASTARLFGNEGFNFGGGGRGVRSRFENPRYREAFARFFGEYQNSLEGSRRSRRILQAAVSTSDFPLLFGDSIDRMLLAVYRRHEAEWQQYVHIDQVMDLRDAKRFYVSTGRGVLPNLSQGETYTKDAQREVQYLISAQKYGGLRDITWETLVNDDLGALKRTPEDLGRQAANTEEYTITFTFGYDNNNGAGKLYHTAHAFAGVNYSNLFGYPFSADALSYVAGVMGEYPGQDTHNTPIDNDVYHIVVGTERMRQKVEQVLNSLIVQYSGSTDRDNLPINNIIDARMRGRIKVHLNKWLRSWDTNYKTAWYLFSDPASGWAVEVSFLSGYREPQLFMKTSNQVLLGGGAVNPMEGSFENDVVSYKVRHVLANASTESAGGWRFTAYSHDNGEGVPD